jgi:hypothetical protein
MTDRERLLALLNALDSSETTLRRDLVRGEGRTGDWAIYGTLGHVYPDGAGYLLYVHTKETPRRWFNVKVSLGAFCRRTQDGDDEGSFHLDRLPAPAEVEVIRDALGIRNRRKVTEEARAHLEAMRRAAKSPSGGRSIRLAA